MRITSFGYKYGRLPSYAHILDCRNLTNPHHVLALRPLTGKDDAVQEFIKADIQHEVILKMAREAVENGAGHVAFGCHGGRHRSVAMAELFAAEITDIHRNIVVDHMAL